MGRKDHKLTLLDIRLSSKEPMGLWKPHPHVLQPTVTSVHDLHWLLPVWQNLYIYFSAFVSLKKINPIHYWCASCLEKGPCEQSWSPILSPIGFSETKCRCSCSSMGDRRPSSCSGLDEGVAHLGHGEHCSPFDTHYVHGFFWITPVEWVLELFFKI